MSNMLVGSDAASRTTLLLSRSSSDLPRLARDRGRSPLKLLCSDLPTPFISTSPFSLTLESSSFEMMGKVEGGGEGGSRERRGGSALCVRQSSHPPSPAATQQSSAHNPLSMQPPLTVSNRYEPFHAHDMTSILSDVDVSFFIFSFHPGRYSYIFAHINIDRR